MFVQGRSCEDVISYRRSFTSSLLDFIYITCCCWCFNLHLVICAGAFEKLCMQSVSAQQCRPVARGRSESSDTPPFPGASAKRSISLPTDCSCANKWHHFNASFILSRVCLVHLVVGLYSRELHGNGDSGNTAVTGTKVAAIPRELG